ncbi:hypothetical protein EVAR_81374_1 [Eumeta japonica]|uniref:Uncharacterized protein n=1 Tax=Eumeta variegata TaxID=151549 RepID=A0A4C1WI19_EUMVA|nr:hypothetical protein EVAR_81374_1 [Eumeta japonica]
MAYFLAGSGGPLQPRGPGLQPNQPIALGTVLKLRARPEPDPTVEPEVTTRIRSRSGSKLTARLVDIEDEGIHPYPCEQNRAHI